jgi:hypothetical protein
MDPIRPIGPADRDLEPVVRVTRSSPDGERRQRDQPEQQKRREPPAAEPQASEDGPEDGSLIDVRV